MDIDTEIRTLQRGKYPKTYYAFHSSTNPPLEWADLRDWFDTLGPATPSKYPKLDWSARDPVAFEAALQEAYATGKPVVRFGKNGDGAFSTIGFEKSRKGGMGGRCPGRDLNARRLYEIERLIVHRHGGPCDTDGDGEFYLRAALPHLRVFGVKARDWAKIMTPKLLEDPEFKWPRETGKIFHLKADTLASILRITPEEREHLRINTMGALGIDKEMREEIAKAKDAAYRRAKVVARGGTPRSQSKSETKPWIADGFNTRRTWERHGMKPRVANSSDVGMGSRSTAEEIATHQSPGHLKIPARSASRGGRRAQAPQTLAA